MQQKKNTMVVCPICGDEFQFPGRICSICGHFNEDPKKKKSENALILFFVNFGVFACIVALALIGVTIYVVINWDLILQFFGLG